MPYNLVADSFHTKKLCSRLSLSAILDRNRAFCFFEPPKRGGLTDNVRCSSWAHCKTRSGLPISVNWTYWPLFCIISPTSV